MKFNHFPTTAITGAALSGVLLTGCGQNPELTFSPDRVKTAMADGFIYDDVNVRTSPQRIEDETDNNSCAKTDTAVILRAAQISISKGIGTDSNGDWVGVKPSALPENIADGCTSEFGGMLWIAKKYVHAEISFSDQPINAAN